MDFDRQGLLDALREAHERVHAAYPSGPEASAPEARTLRFRLLVVDLALHLAERAIQGERVASGALLDKLFSVTQLVTRLAPEPEVLAAGELLGRAVDRLEAERGSGPA
jgi:hypothetical protein